MTYFNLNAQLVEIKSDIKIRYLFKQEIQNPNLLKKRKKKEEEDNL